MLSHEIVEQVLASVQSLPRSEKMKFATYKGRLIGRGKSESEAILEAASKVGVKVADLTGLGVISRVGAIAGVDNRGVSVMTNTDNSQTVVVVTPNEDTVITDDNADTSGMVFPSEPAKKACEIIKFPVSDWREFSAGMEGDNTPVSTTVIKQSSPLPSYLAPAAVNVEMKLKESLAWSGVYGTGSISAGEKLDYSILVKTLLGTIGFLICTPALIYYGAQAGGFTKEAIFWAAFIEVSGSLCLIVPIQHLWRKFACRSVGLGLLALGYLVMHTGIKTHTEGKISTNIVNSDDIRTLEDQESQLKNRINPIIETVNGLDPVEYRGQRTKLLAGIEDDSKRLLEVQDKLIEVRKAKRIDPSSQIAESWGLVEWLRRIALNLVNVISGHSMLAGIPALLLFFRRKREQ